MKLLFDENLPPRLAGEMQAAFPGSAHVRDAGLRGAADSAIWQHAREQGFAVVSKDADFFQRSLLEPPPPVFVWLRVGNCTRETLRALLVRNAQAVLALEQDASLSPLVLW